MKELRPAESDPFRPFNDRCPECRLTALNRLPPKPPQTYLPSQKTTFRIVQPVRLMMPSTTKLTYSNSMNWKDLAIVTFNNFVTGTPKYTPTLLHPCSRPALPAALWCASLRTQIGLQHIYVSVETGLGNLEISATRKRICLLSGDSRR